MQEGLCWEGLQTKQAARQQLCESGSAVCLNLTNVLLDPLANVVCVRLHEVALMALGSVYLVYLPAVQHVVARLQAHLMGVWDDG